MATERRSITFVDSFEALDLSPKEHGLRERVLAAMIRAGRFSCFEASANQTIAHNVDMIFKSKLVKSICGPGYERPDQGYPWTWVELTEAGRKFLKEGSPELYPAVLEAEKARAKRDAARADRKMKEQGRVDP